MKGALTWPPLIVFAILYVPNNYGLGDYGKMPPEIADSAWSAGFVALAASYVAHLRQNERLALALVFTVAALAVVVTVNRVSLLVQLLHVQHGLDGWLLLQTGIVIWADNVLIFSLLYWALDRGGPAARARGATPADWLFPESASSDAKRPQNYIDYLCLAFNTSTAFSPTDVVTLSTRARALMCVQSAISLVTLAVVAARAVNILT
jgi:hypothetical protein